MNMNMNMNTELDKLDIIDKLLETVKKYIQCKKEEENVDLSDNNLFRTWCIMQSNNPPIKHIHWKYNDLLKSKTKTEMTNYILQERYVLERTEKERARRVRKNNIEYLPIIEYIFSSLSFLFRDVKP